MKYERHEWEYLVIKEKKERPNQNWAEGNKKAIDARNLQEGHIPNKKV